MIGEVDCIFNARGSADNPRVQPALTGFLGNDVWATAPTVRGFFERNYQQILMQTTWRYSRSACDTSGMLPENSEDQKVGDVGESTVITKVSYGRGW